MHILTYCDEDLGVAAGGSRQVLELSKALALRGHDVTVMAPEPQDLQPAFLVPPKMRMHWVPVIRGKGLRPASFLFHSIRTLKNLLRTQPPDVLLWFDSPGQIAPLWAFRSHHCPVVYVVNGLPGEEVQGLWRGTPLHGLLTYGIRLAARKAAVVVSVCPELLHSLRSLEPIVSDKCSVIRNGVDPDHFYLRSHEQARKELQLDASASYIGFVGGFFPWHGLETLVDAIAILVKSVPTIQCLLVGDGQTKAEIEKRVHRLHLLQHVHFTGRVDFNAVPTWIAACDVCVVLHRQTRSYPGDSMKLWEYLACGRPVVATAGPGYGDTVMELRCGLPTRVNDPDDLAHQLAVLLGNQDLRQNMGGRGRAAVVKSHAWTARAAEVERLCHHAISRPARAA